MQELKDKLDLTEVVNRLFMHTDAREWELLQSLVFCPKVWFDMSSLGGPVEELSAAAICDLWAEGFAGLDAVHHQAGHYLINVKGDEAAVFAYAVATHYKESASQGKTRSFVGSYELGLVRTSQGWRINRFKYNLKFMEGNASLE